MYLAQRIYDKHLRPGLRFLVERLWPRRAGLPSAERGTAVPAASRNH